MHHNTKGNSMRTTTTPTRTPAIDALAARAAGSYPAPPAPRVVRDRVLTIALGDLLPDGSRLRRSLFYAIAGSIAGAVDDHGGTVYAITYGDGFGSDGVNDGAPEHSAVILAGNVADVAGLRRYVATMLRRSGMTSAACALDYAHEPVFNTPTGARPRR